VKNLAKCKGLTPGLEDALRDAMKKSPRRFERWQRVHISNSIKLQAKA